MSVGIRDKVAIAIIAPQSEIELESENMRKAMGMVYNIGLPRYKREAKKSSHFQMNEKMRVVIRAGVVNGRIIEKNVRHSLQPSIFADSSRSIGIPRINCMIRNMKNGIPKNDGTINGRKVFTQPK